MQCINDQCTGLVTAVKETRPTPAVIYRRRCCPLCNTRYVTVEVLAPDQKIPESAAKRRSKPKP